MALVSITVSAGVLTDFADHDATGRWIDSDLIRFRNGRLQNIGNWRQFFHEPVTGTGRAGVSWTLLDKRAVTAVATEAKLLLFIGGERFDITPERAAGTLAANPFAVLDGSAEVTVNHLAHGCAVGDFVRFSGAGTVGGLDLNGEWQVSTVIDANAYRITHTTAAAATVLAGGGAVAFSYDIHSGLASTVVGRGWGAGGYGDGAWGGPRVQSTASLPLRLWWLSPWGEDLVACHSGGAIYWWDATGGPHQRATALPGAPTDNLGIVVSPEDRHLVVFGADGDPLRLRWADQESLTNWTASAASTANALRLLSGSRIISAMKVVDEILLWTDDALYGLRYTGAASFSHSLRRVARHDGIIAPKAVAEVNGVVFWWGDGQFCRYDGAIAPIPCTIEATIAAQLDARQADKIVASSNPPFSEVVWYWPSLAGDGENDSYVKYSITDDAWDWGRLSRTALIRRGASLMAVDRNGYVYEHETGAVEQAVSLTLRCRKYAAAAPIDFGPYAITPTTTSIRIGARGRHVAVRVEGVFWDGDNVRRVWWAETSSMTISEGGQVMRIDRLVPDVHFTVERLRIGAFRFDIRPDGEQ